MSNRLGGKQGTAYTGTNANQPPNWTFNDRPPTQYDNQNVSEGDLWLDSSSAGLLKVWILVSLAGNSMSKGSLAEWVQFGVGNLEFLTGNSGGPVGPDAFDNINVVGDGITIDVVGNAGTHTLTISAIPGTPSINTLTGNSGGAVSPDGSGNIDVVGTGVITVVGNPGAHSLTVTPSGDIASSFITNPATGTAIPVAGALTFAGAGGVSVSASGHTVTISNSGTPAPQVGFGAYKSVDTPNATGDGTFFQVICDGVIYDLDSNYNGGTGTFTAPTDGTYHFDTYIAAHNITTQNLGSIFLVTTARTFETDLQSPVNDKQADNILHYQMSVDTLMSAGDTAYLQISLSGAAKTVGITGSNPMISPIATYFNGHRLDPAASFITGAETFIADVGSATPNILGDVNVLGGAGISTSAAGNTITISASGAPSPQIGFGAYKSTDSNNVTGDGTFFQVVFDGELYDLDSNYDNTTGIFTAPTTGTYHFDTFVQTHNIGTQNLSGINIETTNTIFHGDLQSPVNDKNADNILHFQLSVDVDMNAGDTALVKVALGGGSGSKTVGVTGSMPPSPVVTYFNGHRLDPALSVISGAETFITDSGTATPNILGQVNVKAGLASLNSGSSVEFTGSSNNVQLNVTDASNNTVIGKNSGNLTLSSTNCTMLGTGCGSGLTTGATNIFIGVDCGSAITTGGNNLIIGDASASTNLTGVATSDGFIGIGSGNGIFIHNFSGNGGGNVFVGYDSGSFNAGQSGSNLDNTAIGQHTLRLITTGTSNSCIGYQAGSALTSGSNNCLLGRDAGIAYTGAESNNICIGINGVVGESNKTKIGGIRGATTTNNDAVAVLIDSAGQLGTVSSSMRYKTNIEPMGSVSGRLMKLEPVTFSWKSDQNYHQQVGLIAEEVDQVMPELVVYDKEGLPETVKYHELPVLLLNELKKLAARVDELESQLNER